LPMLQDEILFPINDLTRELVNDLERNAELGIPRSTELVKHVHDEVGPGAARRDSDHPTGCLVYGKERLVKRSLPDR
jgi:hypothetical protein